MPDEQRTSLKTRYSPFAPGFGVLDNLSLLWHISRVQLRVSEQPNVCRSWQGRSGSSACGAASYEVPYGSTSGVRPPHTHVSVKHEQYSRHH